MKLTFCQLEKNDFDEIVSSFEKIRWNKPKNTYEAYRQEQSDGIRTVILAKNNNKFCGYVTIKWKSDYRFWRRQKQSSHTLSFSRLMGPPISS